MENEVNITEPTTATDFELKISEDKLEVVLSIDALTAAAADTADKIIEKLTEMGIDNLPELELIQTRLKETKYDGDQMQEIVIVRGKSSVMPVDGRLVWSKDYFAEGYKIDLTTNKIDFREKVASPVVLEDDLIIKIIPPTPGEDGIDVYGKLIKVNPPAKAEIKVGPNLRWDEEVSGYRAAVSGRLRMPGASLEIQEVFSIDGDVGCKTGNIKHEGDIIIRGDVDSEYNVEATKTILVTGVIGACNITSGGDLIVNGGINSREDKKISVKGGVKAKYIMNTVLEAGGDVASEVEIVRCKVKAGGEVYCGGRIVGGEIIAGTNITADIAGNDKNVLTLLEIRKTDKSDDSETEDSAESPTSENQAKSEQTDCIRIEEQVYTGTKFTVLGQRHQVKKRMKGPIVALIDKKLKQFVISRYDEKEEPESDKPAS
ncbi:MAG: DUF342 domain-containing protein [candidate division Zixibacteria bacterium]|nr:DUF342 domain-containing protein [candidate division Zixibacteria bacterium]